MKQYIWQQHSWPTFSWSKEELLPILSKVRLKQGKLIQKITSLLNEDLRQVEGIIFEAETTKTAQIEGEKYSIKSIKSSIHRRLGLSYVGLPPTQRHVDGLVKILFDATLNHDKPLNTSRLLSWQAALFPTGYSGLTKIKAGKFRTDETGPMQVISGAIGKEKVHYQAPEATTILKEIELFLNWWQESKHTTDGIIRAGIAHFYFITLHPFDDGNGRIARALTDMALSQDDKLAKRYYSLSNEIINQKQKYYQILEQSQKGNLDITDWLIWFIKCFSSALDTSEDLLINIFQKTKFWNQHSHQEINSRQRKVLNKLLESGKNNLTTRKYINIAKLSRATAIREINNLVDKKILHKNQGKGRNVSYKIKL
ncbi:MAG: Fic family protein [Candidatus Beckwithbacteria bacterium]|nr:Fic family protein [Patescibacteria group bacterium]